MIYNLFNKNSAIVIMFSLIIAFIYFSGNYFIKKNIFEDRGVSASYVYTQMHGNPFMHTGDHNVHTPYIAKIFIGNYNLGETNVFENRGRESVVPLIPYYFAALIANVIGSVDSFLHYSTWMFPLITSIIGIILFSEFTNKSYYLGVMFFVFYYSGLGPSEIAKTLLFLVDDPYIVENQGVGVLGQKYPSYQFVLPYFLLAVYFSYKALSRDETKYYILYGVFIGISAYVYLYTYIALSLQSIAILLYLVISGNYNKSIKIFISGLIGLVISLKYLMDSLKFMWTDIYVDKMIAFDLSMDLGIGEVAAVKIVIKLILLLLFLTIAAKKYKSQVVFITSGYIPLLLLIGSAHYGLLVIEPSHLLVAEVRLFEFFAGAIIIAWLVEYLIDKKNISDRLVSISTALLSIIFMFVMFKGQISHQYNTAKKFYYLSTITKERKEMYEWISSNAKYDDVFVTIDPINFVLLPSHTSRYIYAGVLRTFGNITMGDVLNRFKDLSLYYNISSDDYYSILKGGKKGLYNSTKLEDVNTLDKYKKFYATKQNYDVSALYFSYFKISKNNFAFTKLKKYLSDDQLARVEKEGEVLHEVPYKYINTSLEEYNYSTRSLAYKADYVIVSNAERGVMNLDISECKYDFSNYKFIIYSKEEFDRCSAKS